MSKSYQTQQKLEIDWRLRAWGWIVQVLCSCVCTWCRCRSLADNTTKNSFNPLMISKWHGVIAVHHWRHNFGVKIWFCLKVWLFVSLFAVIFLLFSLAKFLLPQAFLFHFVSSYFSFPGLITWLLFHGAFSNLMLSLKGSGYEASTITKYKNTAHKLSDRLIRLIRGITGLFRHEKSVLNCGIDWQANFSFLHFMYLLAISKV